MIIYFAHPVSHYNTDYERRCLEVIQAEHPDARILNPNADVHAENYKAQGMSYFKDLVNSCDAVVYVPFFDEEVGMGVYTEVMTMVDKGGPIYRAHLGEIKKVEANDVYAIRPLSILQTRERIRNKTL